MGKKKVSILVALPNGRVIEYNNIKEFKSDYNIGIDIDYSKIENIIVTSGNNSFYQYLSISFANGSIRYFQLQPFSSNNYSEINFI